MRDAVIVEAVRTPVGKRNGSLSGVHPVDLAAHVLEAIATRTGVDPAVWLAGLPGASAELDSWIPAFSGVQSLISGALADVAGGS